MGLTGKKTVATDGISVDGEIIDEGQYEENVIAMKQGGSDVGKEAAEQTEKIASTMNREISKDYHVDNEIKEGGNHE